MYEARTYRRLTGDTLQKVTVIDGETDIQVLFSSQADHAAELVRAARASVESAIFQNEAFLKSLSPLPHLIETATTDLERSMIKASNAAGVGPMAAVAGAISAYVGEALSHFNADVIVENGGDLYIKTSIDRQILIHAGSSPLSEKLAIRIKSQMTPLGICTSSGTVGHSLSFGKTDATVILAKDPALADAVATATGNLVKTADDIPAGLSFAQNIDAVLGALIIVQDKIGVWGQVDLVRV